MYNQNNCMVILTFAFFATTKDITAIAMVVAVLLMRYTGRNMTDA